MHWQYNEFSFHSDLKKTSTDSLTSEHIYMSLLTQQKLGASSWHEDDTSQTIGLDGLNAVPGIISCLHDIFLRPETEQSTILEVLKSLVRIWFAVEKCLCMFIIWGPVRLAFETDYSQIRPRCPMSLTENPLSPRTAVICILETSPAD